MSKQHKYILVALGLLTLLLGACSRQGNFIWEEFYRENGNQPYDIGVFYELLQATNNKTEVLTNNFRPKLRDGGGSSNFIQFGERINLDTQKIEALKNYVARGNNAFLISKVSPSLLLSFLYDDFSDTYYYTSSAETVEVKFKEHDQTYKFAYQYNNEFKEYAWASLLKGELRSDSASQPIDLAYLGDNRVTYFQVRFGEGSFYFHTNPMMFTNYQMQKEDAFEHAQKVFKNLNAGKIYWDKSYLYRQLDEETPDRQGASVLKLFFTHESLKWGWFVFLIAALLFILFRSKREQRIIPIMPVNRNESIEFAKNVGNLYFKTGTHGNIALEMYNIFLHDIRQQYQIDTNRNKEELIALLYKKSGLKLERIEALFEKFKLRFSEFGKSQELIELYNELEHFYKNKK